MEVNINKTKLMVFRNGGKVTSTEKWIYNGKHLELVDIFSYLGFILYYNNKFTVAVKHLPDQGRKAQFALYIKTKSLKLNIVALLSLFVCYIVAPTGSS